jgi:DHA1 family inner membrane transport protein
MAAVGLLAASLCGLYVFGPVKAATIALLAIAGMALSGVPTAVQNRIMQVAPGSTEMASAGNSAGFNVGIGGGALIGGVLLPVYGVRSTALVGAVLAAAGLAALLTEPTTAPERAPGAVAVSDDPRTESTDQPIV